MKEGYRLDQISYTSCSDDYDEIDVEAMFAELRREAKYKKIINELYCMFISKICTEVDRISLLAAKIRIHDDMGKLLLATKRRLAEPTNETE